MTMKSIFFAVAVAALVGAAIASCPNACSGHGSCGNHDRCTCYANFVGGDCSEKACPYGRSGQECSGRGTCDRGAGSCECADGYSGASCQRTSCPNDCSGKGSCDTTTGMCNCAGGYSGNDCGTRLCPKGDDPLTHEVENSGDGTASQQSEVQTVTFNAGRGLGGTATLTYNDLYGQSWTTRPFNVGGDNVYRLEVAIKAGEPCNTDAEECTLTFTFGSGNTADVIVTNAAVVPSAFVAAGGVRDKMLPLFGGHAAKPSVFGKDRGNTIYVRKHHSLTSAKLGGAIEAGVRATYDIYIPIDMSGHDDNGGQTSLTVAWKAAASNVGVNARALNLYQLGDRSAEIERALTSLPNQVIPSVTVSKNGVTDTDTNSDSASGNIYAQSYSITFNNEANSGDQNMLTCNAGPCDEDGCINRGPGVSEVRYMHHDPENHGEGINFVNQGYFIMDIGEDVPSAGSNSGAYQLNDPALPLSAGSIKIMWDTGAGIDSAIFAIVATAAEVQTALRTITGWEAVTVELWGSTAIKTASAADKVLVNHQFKVTFAAGYDDLGKSPTFYTMQNTDGAYAAPSPANARARLYDQRFSNSIWLGKTTGFVECVTAATDNDPNTCVLKHTDIGGVVTTLSPMPQNGDVWVTSDIYFGAGGAASAASHPPSYAATGNVDLNEITIHHTSQMTDAIFMYAVDGTTDVDTDTVFDQMGDILVGVGSNFAYLKEGATSVQTSDYFAVGSSIEVLPVTWDDGDNAATAPTGSDKTNTGTDISGTNYNSNNLYRKFKVTGHVTNEFNREFAKLDTFPADDGITPASTNADKPDYNLKITSNNATVHTYPSVPGRINVNEVQVIVMGTGQTDESGQIFKLYYKGEESQDMTQTSTEAQVAEEINGFSALSGPVTVAKEGTKFLVTFDKKDGDVAQMTAAATAGVVNVVTRAHGWSIEAPISLSDTTLSGLDTMQAGGIINVTAQEVCEFTETIAGTAGQYCYDGVCGPFAASGTGAHHETALQAIKDDNGDAILGTAAIAETLATTTYTITMPLGKSCDGLELRGSTNVVEKQVNKNNNGKLFKITRSFSTATVTGGTLAASELTCAEEGDDRGCHQLVLGVDSVVIADVSSCGARVLTPTDGADGPTFPIHRKITGVTATAGTVATAVAAKAALGATGAAAGSVTHTSNCIFSVGRHVITLDSMPTASATTVTKSLEYTSPVGSCSVAETTKGTYESFECSNRGACDGKSGLCTCYEGYSGQSCQTQTVLV